MTDFSEISAYSQHKTRVLIYSSYPKTAKLVLHVLDFFGKNTDFILSNGKSKTADCDFVILETSVPEKTPFKQGYNFYSKNILPLIGKIFSKDDAAYGYLSESAAAFPFGEALNNILRKIGFIDVVALPQTFGVATIYSASKK